MRYAPSPKLGWDLDATTSNNNYINWGGVQGLCKGFFYKITYVGINKTVIKKTDAYTDVCEVRTLRQAF